MDYQFVAVDIETTTHPEKFKKITEVSLIPFSFDKTNTAHTTYLNPDCPICWNDTRVSGIKDEHVRGAQRFEDFFPKIEELLKGRIYVGHNAKHDITIISQEASRLGKVFQVEKSIDTLTVSRQLLGLKSAGLDSVGKYFCIPESPRHRAEGDALRVIEIFKRLYALSLTKGIDLLAPEKIRNADAQKRLF